MSEVLVAARDLEREYRVGPETVRVLRGVTLAVGAGESVALIGASGVGKSTLLHLLGGLDRPTAGQVLFAGEDMYARSESALARLRRTEIAFIFQFYNLLGEMTALENAMMPALLQRLPTLQARERGAAALHEVGLGDRLAHRPGELSGGEQQRVAIARALVAEPRLVLADEPTGNLDTRTSVEVMAVLQEMNRSGITVVLVTHEADISNFASRVITFRDGRVQKDETAASLLEARKILATLPVEREDAA